jgi:hypothetical protein
MDRHLLCHCTGTQVSAHAWHWTRLQINSRQSYAALSNTAPTCCALSLLADVCSMTHPPADALHILNLLVLIINFHTYWIDYSQRACCLGFPLPILIVRLWMIGAVLNTLHRSLVFFWQKVARRTVPPIKVAALCLGLARTTHIQCTYGNLAGRSPNIL